MSVPNDHSPTRSNPNSWHIQSSVYVGVEVSVAGSEVAVKDVREDRLEIHTWTKQRYGNKQISYFRIFFSGRQHRSRMSQVLKNSDDRQNRGIRLTRNRFYFC